MLKVLRDKRFAWIPSLSAGALVLLIGLVLAPGAERSLETVIYDRALRSSSVVPTPNVIVITIDQASTERLGSWPWPRSIHAQLIKRLHDYGTRTVAFTLPMSEPQNRVGLDRLRAALDLLKSDPSRSEQTTELKNLLDSSVADLDDDRALTEAIALHGNVILPVETTFDATSNSAAAVTLNERAHAMTTEPAVGAALSTVQLRPPAEILATAARGVAHNLVQPDDDQIVRSDLAAVRDGDRLVPSLALAIAASLNSIDVTKIQFTDADQVVFGERKLILDKELRWRGTLFPANGPRAIKKYSYWQVLAGEVQADELRGKTVVVGLDTNASLVGIATPLGEILARPAVVASFAASLAANQTYRAPVWGTIIQWLLCVGVLALSVWLLPQIGVWWAIGSTVVLSTGLLFGEIGLINLTGTWLHLALPVFALIAATLATGVARAGFRLAGSSRSRASDPIGSLRTLGLTFQGQGQLDLAYETFRRCPADNETLEFVYGLGQDYERRRQFGKAAAVYGYIMSVDAHFKDVQARRERMKRSEIALNASAGKASKPDSARGPSATVTPLRPDIVPSSRASEKQTLGRYEIERELGKGAMGVVYLGRDPKINRVVAIKAIALAEEFAEEDVADARARFFREAEMAGRLNHPGIVTVYDAGEDRGLAFIAMEYLRGEHLSKYAEPIHLLPVAKVLALMSRVADALDYAHKQNVVHRDIKPANIMFNADTDELKITDFGIARLTDTSRTKTGIVLGTPSFMSPEQLEGRPLDGRSDLFSLGVAMYQLLSGQLPFRADSMTRLMHKIAIEPHVPLLSLRPELPELAEQIVARTLAKSAQDRYQTGAELAVALRGCIKLILRKDALAR